eukprot:31103-Pelagococcus_subviridis.AAC.16
MTISPVFASPGSANSATAPSSRKLFATRTNAKPSPSYAFPARDDTNRLDCTDSILAYVCNTVVSVAP